MDPLTAFSTAGTVLQVVDFGAKVVRLAVEYAQDGGTSEVAYLEGLVQTLISTSAELQQKLSSTDQSRVPGSGRALHVANEKCLAVSLELVALLRSLKLDKIGWWHAARSAFREHRAQARLKELRSRLEAAKSNLAICFLVYVTEQTRQANHLNGETKQDIVEIKNTLRSSRDLTAQIDGLTDAMAKTAIDQTHDESRIYSILISHSSELSSISKQLEKHLQSTTKKDDIRQKVQDLETRQAFERRILESIISSLRFSSMNDRKRSIKRAHTETFQWIFETHSESNKSWDDFTSWLGDEDSQRMYWIRGKPGSGKSTLVREMLEEITRSSPKGLWLRGKDFLVVSGFFWYAGGAAQRSLEGLLQTLLHQIFQRNPYLIRNAVSRTRWKDHTNNQNRLLSWSAEELQLALQIALENLDSETRLLFLIDGLDEFEGDDEARLDMVQYFDGLTQRSPLKICFSSRPWNVYKDAFEGVPQLRLEQLTRSDIIKFVHDSLSGDEMFMRKSSRTPQLVEQLTATIADNAEGVFLWVRLVVRDLLKSVRDGCLPKHLFTVLEKIPRDLDDYFLSMMHRMDPVYRRDAAIILNLMLCDMSASGSCPVQLLDLYYLDDVEPKAHFVLDPSFDATELSSYQLSELEDLSDSLERRLTSRGMGLLELYHNNKNLPGALRSEVIFLHRSVKDFLYTPRARAQVEQFAGEPFDCFAFRHNILIANIITFDRRLHQLRAEVSMEIGARLKNRIIEERSAWLRAFLSSVRLKAPQDEYMIRLYRTAARVSWLFEYLDARSINASWRISKFGMNRTDTLMLLLAIACGWTEYVELVQPTEIQQSAGEQALLHVALQGRLRVSHTTTEPVIVQRLLLLGADPNAMIESSDGFLPSPSHGAQHTDLVNVNLRPSIWISFLVNLGLNASEMDNTRHEKIMLVIKALITARARHYLAITQLKIVSEWYSEDFLDRFSNNQSFEGIRCVSDCPDLDGEPSIHVLELLRQMKKADGENCFSAQYLMDLQELCLKVDSERKTASRNMTVNREEEMLSRCVGQTQEQIGQDPERKRRHDCTESEEISAESDHKRRRP